MKEIRFKGTGNRWADAAIGVVVLIALYLLVGWGVGIADYLLH